MFTVTVTEQAKGFTAITADVSAGASQKEGWYVKIEYHFHAEK